MSTLVTYNDTSRPEDLVSVVTNVSPMQTPLLSRLSRGADAKQTLHEYLSDTFAASTDSAAIEGAAFSSDTLKAPDRLSNVTQIFRNDIEISGTEQVVSEPAAMAYQASKTLKEHAKNIERALMAGTQASGATNAARRMTGVIAALTTNATTQASATSLTETVYNDLLELVHASTDEFPNMIFVGAHLKRAISAFTGGTTKNIDATTKKVTNMVSIYEGDFGVQEIMIHREVPAAASGHSIVGINSEYHRLSYLRPTQIVDVAKVGDSDRKMLVTEMTIEHKGEKTGFVSNRHANAQCLYPQKGCLYRWLFCLYNTYMLNIFKKKTAKCDRCGEKKDRLWPTSKNELVCNICVNK